MRQFGKIFKFELLNYTKNKAFVGVTVFLVVAMAILMFFPRFIELFDKQEEEPPTDVGEKPIMLVVPDDASQAEGFLQLFSESFPNYQIKISEPDIDAIKQKISAEEAECAIVLDSPTSYTYYVNNLSMYDTNSAVVDATLIQIYQMNAMIGGGLSPEQATQILGATIDSRIENLGKDQFQNFFYTYVMIFALYMVILLYGQMVATNVATEKSSRAMEVLITSAKPTSMMFGKVFASCFAGFMQLVLIFGSALVFFRINKSYWDEIDMISSFFNIPLDLFIYMLIFFILGFLVYAFLYGAIGSTASKLEDINTSVMPLTMMFIVAFVVVMTAMGSGDVDTPLMIVCSYIPFTSPMAMFTRIAMSTVPIWEIAISIAVLVASVFGIGVLSAKIYRVGVLLYGTPPKLTAILKAIRQK